MSMTMRTRTCSGTTPLDSRPYCTARSPDLNPPPSPNLPSTRDRGSQPTCVRLAPESTIKRTSVQTKRFLVGSHPFERVIPDW